ncbi:Translational repressor MPT5/PUF4 and related RNA-binding proteins (Puf superfamily) [Handroanthus impetiginosus]|uniref:Translational repressor MPT5/PUF4 and related RNA-binding proteins (Puf superfamily) n=1 Tax=Handroanthus impetiginosus TaxID=429701 RepID=A0A2G9G7R5_9LAMI|nr:Translational repressor MPT5/PUF4 and related RNA-binding proteins (Puf superfamily) [Handroanthus impetiginosus]
MNGFFSPMDSQSWMNASPFPADSNRRQLPSAAANAALFDITNQHQFNNGSSSSAAAASAAGYRLNGGVSGNREETNPTHFNRLWAMNSVGQSNPSYFNNSNYDANPLELEFNRLNLSVQSNSSDLIAPSPVYNSALGPTGSAAGGPNVWGNQSGSINLNSPNFSYEQPPLSIADIQRLRVLSAAQSRFNPLGCENPFNFNRNNVNSHYRSASTNRFDSNSTLNRYNSSLYRQSRYRQNFLSASLEELRDEIFSMAKDQYGCRFLQDKLKEGNPQGIEIIFWELKDHICELMKDQFGNYIMQELFRVCNEEQINELLLLAVNDDRSFKDICIDMHGTRAVQKLLDHLTTREQKSLVISILRRITIALTKSLNGHHVILHCLKNFSVQDNKHILDEVADKCLEIATDRSGCCVLQQCLGQAHEEPRERLIAEITSNALILSEHPYGNYVVQYILGLQIPRVTAAVISQLSGNFVSLSMNKYGSNVVEKFLKMFDDDSEKVVSVIEEIIYSPNFLRVLQDPYGNYVAQSALTFSKGPIRHALINRILINYAFLHSHPHGKRVLSRTRVSRQRT